MKMGNLNGVLKASSGVVSGSSTTSDLTEGSNLYYTAARFNSAFSGKTTADLTEGSNLYYTDARVKSAAAAATPAQEFYVTKDNGNDANDCSILKPCKTIQAGLNAAAAVSSYYKQTLVHVAPASGGTGSSYNENITFAQQGINLQCDGSMPQHRACLISGSVTVDMTGTTGGGNYVAASNESYMSGFVAVVNSASVATFNFIGTTYQRFIINNCYFDQNGSFNTFIMSNSGTSSGSTSLIKMYDSDVNNSNATNPAVSLTNGRFWIYGTTSTISNGTAAGPSVTQSGTTSLIANLTQITGQYNLTSNTATATFNLTTIAAGSNPCLVTPSSPNTGYALLAYFGCTSSNTNSVTGTGVVVSAGGSSRVSSSGDIISTVTQSVFNSFPQGQTLIGAGASTVTNSLLTLKNAHFTVQQTTAPTAAVNSNAGTGGSPACTLTNATDHSGKIVLTTGLAVFLSGTQCTITFNKAFAVAPNCVFSPNNVNAASKAVSQQVNFTTTTTTLLVSFGAADSAQTVYNWMYSCSEKG